MNEHEHELRKMLRQAIESAMTADLDLGEAVEVGVLAAEVFATAAKPADALPSLAHVVTWPAPGHEPMRQALGYYGAAAAHAKAACTDGADIWMLELR